MLTLTPTAMAQLAGIPIRPATGPSRLRRVVAYIVHNMEFLGDLESIQVLMNSAAQIEREIVRPHCLPDDAAGLSQNFSTLSPYEKQLLEDQLIEGVTLERLGREQDLP
jgi:hypothetical protein